MEKVQFVKTFGGRISILLDRIHGHILLPTALSLALSLRAATNLPLSHDEFYTRHAIQEGLDLHLWEAPSLPYYVVQWIATGGGALDSDLGLRLVSVIAVAVTVACVAEAARQMASKTSAYIAGFLMALSGVALTRAAEARPYALGLSIFVISFLLLLRMMRQQNRSSSLAYGTSLVLGLLIMPQGIVVLIPHALIVLQRDRNWDRLKRWALSVLPAAFLVLVGATVAWLNVFPNMHNWLDSPTVTQFVDGLLWVGGAGNSRPGAGSYFEPCMAVDLRCNFGCCWPVLGLARRDLLLDVRFIRHPCPDSDHRSLYCLRGTAEEINALDFSNVSDCELAYLR